VRRLLGPLLLWCLGCGLNAGVEPIFIDGRAVATMGDSLFALTRSGRPVVYLKPRSGGKLDSIGAGILSSPQHLQAVGSTWYVSDVVDGKPQVVALDSRGKLLRRIDLSPFGATPHQFAILPDGHLVFEIPGGALRALRPDDSTSAAPFGERPPEAPKPGLLVAAAGGVAHAVPDRFVILFNGFGKVRWQLEWPWAKTAFFSDFCVDSHGRIHLIAGVPDQGTFIVYSISSETGEVVRWSSPGTTSSFTIDRLGEIRTADARDWGF